MLFQPWYLERRSHEESSGKGLIGHRHCRGQTRPGNADTHLLEHLVMLGILENCNGYCKEGVHEYDMK